MRFIPCLLHSSDGLKIADPPSKKNIYYETLPDRKYSCLKTVNSW